MTRLALLFTALAVLAPLSAAGGGAPVALLIPDKRICLEGTSTIRVGVRYTANPTGPRWFQVEIRNARGERVLSRRGVASRSWQLWKHDPRMLGGVYRTLYRTSTNTELFRTVVARCRD